MALQLIDQRECFRHYVLICWRDTVASTAWHFALLDPRTQQRQAFLELPALIDALQAQLSKGDADK